VASGYTVTKKNDKNRYDAQFGLVLASDPKVCEAGYVDRRPPADLSEKPMVTTAGCKDGGKNLRGAEKAPRTGAAYRTPVATYDANGKVTWSDQDTSAKIAYDGGAAQLYGEDSWKWMILQPALATTRSSP